MLDLPPRLDIISFHGQEREVAAIVQSSLYELHGYLDEFNSALALFDWCKAQRDANAGNPDFSPMLMLANWMTMAGRDGAMTLFHVIKTMEATRKLLPTCPSLHALIDHDALRSAVRLFRQHFPRTEAMRHSVAHTAEMTRNPDDRKLNAFSGDYSNAGFVIDGGSGIILKNVQNGRTVTTTYEGQILTYDLSAPSLENLRQSVQEFYRGFRNAAMPEPWQSAAPQPPQD